MFITINLLEENSILMSWNICGFWTFQEKKLRQICYEINIEYSVYKSLQVYCILFHFRPVCLEDPFPDGEGQGPSCPWGCDPWPLEGHTESVLPPSGCSSYIEFESDPQSGYRVSEHGAPATNWEIPLSAVGSHQWKRQRWGYDRDLVNI